MKRVLSKILSISLSVCILITMSLGLSVTGVYATMVQENFPIELEIEGTPAQGTTFNVNIKATEDMQFRGLEGTFVSSNAGISFGSVTNCAIYNYETNTPGYIILADLGQLNASCGALVSAGAVLLTMPVTLAAGAACGTYDISFNLISGALLDYEDDYEPYEYENADAEDLTASFGIKHNYNSEGICTNCGGAATLHVTVNGANAQDFTVAQLKEYGVHSTENWYYTKNSNNKYTTVTGITYANFVDDVLELDSGEICNIQWTGYSKGDFTATNFDYDCGMIAWYGDGNSYCTDTGFMGAADGVTVNAGWAWPRGVNSINFVIGHTVVSDAAVAATCTQAAMTEGSHCSVCGKVIVAQETSGAALSHNYVNGYCSYCGAAEPAAGKTLTINNYVKEATVSAAGATLAPLSTKAVATTTSAMIEGDYLYVECEKPCVVAVGDTTSAAALTAIPVSGNTYKFDIASLSDGDTINIALRGDANLDGVVNRANDASEIFATDWTSATVLKSLISDANADSTTNRANDASAVFIQGIGGWTIKTIK